jgi:hypothetical protein
MSPQAYIDLCNESFDCYIANRTPAAGTWKHTAIAAGGLKANPDAANTAWPLRAI